MAKGQGRSSGQGVKLCRLWNAIIGILTATSFLRNYPAYKNGQLNVSDLARVCDLSRTTVYKYIGLGEKS